MKKKILIIIGLIIIIGIFYFGFFAFQNYQFKNKYNNLIKKTLSVEEEKKYQRDIVRCNWNIFSPEFAFVSGKIDPDISFHKTPVILSGEIKNSLEYYTGGTTVKNTDFQTLLKMVKEDCYQFKTGSQDILDKGIVWSYSKYDKEAEEKRKKEREEKRKKEIEWYNNLSEEEKEKIRKENEEFEKKVEEFKKLPKEEKLKILRAKFED